MTCPQSCIVTGSPRPSLRVLHVLSGDLWAGAEVMAYQLVSGLRLGNDCVPYAVVLNEGQVADKLREQGIRVTVLDETRYSFMMLLFKLRRVIRKVRPDVIHSHRYKENLLSYIASRGGKRIPLVATQHGMPEIHGRQASLKGKVKRGVDFSLLSKRFHALVAVSNEMKDSLVSDRGFDPGRVKVIHNGIELPRAQERSESENGCVIGSCGRLFPVKNYSLFMEIAERIVARSPGARFELAGDGPQMEQLREKCHQARIDGNFTFLGHVQDMPSFYQGLDVYVSTSLHEGIPMSVLEAMSYALPVVAPNVGGFPEIIDHGVDGYLIPGHDPDLFSEACLSLLNDADLLERMSRAARKKIETRFSVLRMTDDYLRLYQKVATHNPKSY